MIIEPVHTDFVHSRGVKLMNERRPQMNQEQKSNKEKEEYNEICVSITTQMGDECTQAMLKLLLGASEGDPVCNLSIMPIN